MSQCQKYTLIRWAEFLRRLGISKSSGYDRLDPKSSRYDPNMPRPVSLGGARAVGFIESEVDAYISALVAASREV